MRARRAHQRSLFDTGYADHDMGRGLATISSVLDRHPELVDWIAEDVDGGGRSSMGRAGLPCEVILRCGILNCYVRLEETIESFERVAAGEFDHLPEQAFYMKGGIDQVIEAAREMGAGC